jgi:SagB-type dehydrogenase family enzyme
MAEVPDPIEVILGYHERTKHHLQRYARALGYMDWATQPDPFRRYEGAPQFLLDEVPVTEEPSYDSLFGASGLPSQALDRASVSQFFYDALALSAWKEHGTHRWPLRVNPSSGNLHPTEGYLLTGAVPGLSESPGLFHYSPYLHALEQRRPVSPEAWAALGLPAGAFLIGLTSIYWRESWKYGERAFRYCQHDVGHALGALAVSASALGWQMRIVEGIPDALLATLFGVSEQSGPEAEHPDTLILIAPREAEFGPLSLELLAALAASPLSGFPNTLSAEHHDWPIIEVASEAVMRVEAHVEVAPSATALPARVPPHERAVSGRQIIHQRRSAVSMDGVTSISRDEFFRMLERVTPQVNPGVFGAFPWKPSVHLALFVHRVRELTPGLYCLVRDPDALPSLSAAMRPEFEWAPVEGGLYRLLASDALDAARTVCCHQEIAADGAFALGMIAHFEPAIRERGAWFYKRLHWEAGAIGQQLYLEAEAAGVRATGIGCFFDDAMHTALGLQDATFQTIYHFTVGGPVEDGRLRTVPPYAHRAA